MDEPQPEVVRAAAGGDLAAFDALVRAYQAPLWRFLRHLLGDADLAEDVAQETFLRAYLALSSFRAGARFSTWLFQIGRNAGLDAIKARTRRRYYTSLLRPPSPMADAHARVELADALAGLPTALREALLVVEVLGFTYDEASAVIGVPAGTVKSRVFRARTTLAGQLAEERADEV